MMCETQLDTYKLQTRGSADLEKLSLKKKQLQKDFGFIAEREQSTLSFQTPLGFSL